MARNPDRPDISPLTAAIEGAIRAIPRGRVATYGKIAQMAGMPNGARQVARVLHTRSRVAGLPWHRVVGASGAHGARAKISLQGDGFDEQRALLESEGVRVELDGVISLTLYGWAEDARD